MPGRKERCIPCIAAVAVVMAVVVPLLYVASSQFQMEISVQKGSFLSTLGFQSDESGIDEGERESILEDKETLSFNASLLFNPSIDRGQDGGWNGTDDQVDNRTAVGFLLPGGATVGAQPAKKAPTSTVSSFSTLYRIGKRVKPPSFVSFLQKARAYPPGKKACQCILESSEAKGSSIGTPVCKYTNAPYKAAIELIGYPCLRRSSSGAVTDYTMRLNPVSDASIIGTARDTRSSPTPLYGTLDWRSSTLQTSALASSSPSPSNIKFHIAYNLNPVPCDRVLLKSNYVPYSSIVMCMGSTELKDLFSAKDRMLELLRDYCFGSDVSANDANTTTVSNRFPMLNKKGSRCFKDMDYIPRTWLVRSDGERRAFLETYQNETEPIDYFIVKALLAATGNGNTIKRAREVEKYLMGPKINLATDSKLTEIQRRNAVERIARLQSKGVIVQEYTHQPLLWAGSKFSLRAFAVIASVNPLIVLYRDGPASRSPLKYRADDFSDKLSHMPNVHREGFNWNMRRPPLQKLQQYLDTNFKSKKGYVDKTLRPSMQAIMADVVRSLVRQRGDRHYWPLPGTMKILCFDFLLDKNFKLYFHETNSNCVVFPGYPHLKGPVQEQTQQAITVDSLLFAEELLYRKKYGLSLKPTSFFRWKELKQLFDILIDEAKK